MPSKIITDNAKTFKAAAKEVVAISRSEGVQRYLTDHGVTWDFITEKAPWHGGFWERLIKSTKRCLKKSIGRASLTFEELRTILVEIEATLNNRPLTFIYDDEQGISYPLTPGKNGSTARVFWKLAKIESLITSKDNVVRSATVRVLDKENKKIIILRRPIQHLIPLEIRSEIDEPETVKEKPEGIEEQPKNDQHSYEGATRTKRKAAILGEQRRKKCT
jgi:hypothetical protein